MDLIREKILEGKCIKYTLKVDIVSARRVVVRPFERGRGGCFRRGRSDSGQGRSQK